VRLEECEALWAANQSFDHPDVSLPQGWHLNRARLSVSPAPPMGLTLVEKRPLILVYNCL
jgi:hypothetical protein